MVNNLCTVYNSLNPFCLQEKPFCEVVGLYKDVRRMQIRGEKSQRKEGKKVIRKRASDDAGWW